MTYTLITKNTVVLTNYLKDGYPSSDTYLHSRYCPNTITVTTILSLISD